MCIVGRSVSGHVGIGTLGTSYELRSVFGIPADEHRGPFGNVQYSS